jgi:uncharacterized protein with von Willebrand factor type A (vWA) domain
VDAPYHHLDALPRGLWLPSLVTAAGHTEHRLSQLPAWRAALLRGELPDAGLDFGDAAAVRPLRAAIGELGLPALCRDTPAFTDQVLRTMLWHLDRLIDLQPHQSREAAITQVVSEFREAWSVEKGDWDEVMALLRGLGDLALLRWDALRGRLQSREWQEARRIAEVLQRLPALAELIDRLGRREPLPVSPTPSPGGLGPQPTTLVPRVTRLMDAPSEVRGVRRSGDLSRLLASEAVQMHHPVLRRLWRARLVERQLLTLEDEAELVEWVPDPHPATRPASPTPTPKGRGPFIVCLDTSGSMRDAPEAVAKAVVLQALRTAHATRRACRLIAFGGEGEIIEHELSLAPQGLDALLTVMGQAFDGGTDLQLPLARAIEAVHEAGYTQADLLIASDGEFGVTPATLAQLDAARERFGLRVQGVLIGDRETMGLLEVCDDIHWVRDWRRYAGDGRHTDGFTPVHSKSLTALYFPNALSPRAVRHRRDPNR